ncbi:hypothetical protein AA101099_2834 [Neoasaia chiangmaiensis NBRC 101099]|uniref:Uncharacterized protein n=1 Tax=Neoasaia chiangmaiensis TaxID=320497 RepID=A0A1U9KP09_9PROT|nr:hypothetical protein [Neoasaia chiangmaiensis]AQS87545.1 hypothetical protein A0U93_05885 [Neoasaia chiangmaiensis]GBR42327.1 hypothetical protein AA101099_2834 [Neoasaia chiangmaiensis NBRC 101099]GEN14088.1 hypothetical protein NCH01_05190 [Neoasaia chiangmaiensis]
MIEVVIAAIIVALCAAYWGARLFPRQWASLRATAGLAPKMTAGNANSACGACKACKGGSCH